MKKQHLRLLAGMAILSSLLISSCGISISRNYYYGYQKNSDKPISKSTTENPK